MRAAISEFSFGERARRREHDYAAARAHDVPVPERTIKRKVQEAILTYWMEQQLAKEEILSRYLNTAYFGAGVYGVDAAAKRYFGKTAKELSLSEAAMLAGLVRAPSALAPTRNLEGAQQRAGAGAQRDG